MDNQNNAVTPSKPVDNQPTTVPAQPPVLDSMPSPTLSQPNTTPMPAEPATMNTPQAVSPVVDVPTLMSTSSEPVPASTAVSEQPIPDLVHNEPVSPPPSEIITQISDPKPSVPEAFSVSTDIPQAPVTEPLTETPVLPILADASAGIQTEDPTMPIVEASAQPDATLPVAPAVQVQSDTNSNISTASGDNKKKRGLSGKTALLGFIIGLVVLSIPVSVILVQQQQNLLQEAKTKKNVPVRTSPEVLIATPTPIVPLTVDSAPSELDKSTKDIDDAVSTVDQDMSEINQTDSKQDSESL